MALLAQPIINVTPPQTGISDPYFLSHFRYLLTHYIMHMFTVFLPFIICLLSLDYTLKEGRGMFGFILFSFKSLFYLHHLEQVLKQIMNLINIC